MIRVKDLSVRYKQQNVIDNLCLEIDAGESVLLTGPSGCGKSTLAKAITGLIPSVIPAVVKGLVTIDNTDTRSVSVAEMGRKVGFVFQNPSTQLFHLKVDDEIAFGPRNLNLTEEEVSERVEWALQATGIENLRQADVRTLSGGQKQHVAIAATLAMRPNVLVMDEPTASLDLSGIHRLTETLRQLRSEYDITLLILEHRVAEVVDVIDRVVVMDQGRVVADNNKDRVFSDKDLRDRLGLRRPLKKPPAEWRQLISAEFGGSATTKPLVELRRVNVVLDQQKILKNISLKIFPGDFLAVVGDNGAGKTTLGRTIAGLLKVDSGVQWFNGKPGKPKPAVDTAILFQNPTEQLFTNKVADEVSFSAANHRCLNQKRVDEIMDKLGLEDIRERQPISVSIGQQQRTALASCLSMPPKLLILDEPTLGQDWLHLTRLMDYITFLNTSGTTILLISHDYKLVHHYARRVALLRHGEIEMDGSV